MTAGASQHLGTKSYNFDHVPGAKGPTLPTFRCKGCDFARWSRWSQEQWRRALLSLGKLNDAKWPHTSNPWVSLPRRIIKWQMSWVPI
jgi:hypothetical protein